jgi:hypothetical protein
MKTIMGVEKMRYSIKILKGSLNAYKSVSFDILEDGIAIARGTRKSGDWDIKLKFYTQNSSVRFHTFCGELDAQSVIEILPIAGWSKL